MSSHISESDVNKSCHEQVSILGRQERAKQSSLVKMIQEANSMGLFDKDYKIKSNTGQRKFRYSLAADQVSYGT